MSNLLKSKFLMGVMIVTAVLVGVAALPASTDAASCTITMTLRQGSTGPEVECLQSLVGAGVDGKFGPMTKAKVVAWQQAHALMGDGVVGPLTRAALMQTTGGLPAGCQAGWLVNPMTGESCVGGDDDNTPSGPLEGNAGDITVSGKSTYSNEDVGEGDEDVKVAAFDIEADDGSDVQIKSMKVEMHQESSADSRDAEDYMTSVSVWMGSEKVGEADVEDFSDSATTNLWVETIALDDAVVKAGDTETFYLAVSAVSSLDSGDINSDDWDIGVSSIRFVDGDGVTTTDSLTLDVTDNDATDDTVEEQFDFETFAEASDIELKVAADDDEINEAHSIDIDDTDDTDDVELLSFTLEVDGSDMWVDEIPVNFDTVGVNIADAISTVKLLMDGEEVGSESLDDADLDETATFNDLDLDLKDGEEYAFVVTGNLKSIADGIAAGDTISAQISSTERALIVGEDETGEDLASGDLTGSAVGEAHAMYDQGITVKFVDSDYVKTSSDTTGINETVEFTLRFDVTAFGDDIWVEKTCIDNATPASNHTTDVVVSLDNDANGDNTTCTDFDSTGDEGTTGFEVQEGETERFTVTVLGNGGEAGGAGSSKTFTARLESIGFNVTTDAAGDTQYALNLADFKSAAVTVFDR